MLEEWLFDDDTDILSNLRTSKEPLNQTYVLLDFWDETIQSREI